MEILQTSFTILQWIGLWRPIHWRSGWKKYFYDSYTWFIMILVLSAVLSEFIELTRSMEDVQSFASTAFASLTMVGHFCKAANILIKRKQIIELLDTIENEHCRIQDDEEFQIREKFNQLARLNTLRFAALVYPSIIWMHILSAIPKMARRELPFKAWLPYDATTFWGFWITNIYQKFAHCAAASFIVAFDTLVPGFMIHIAGQLNILKYRFKTMQEILRKRENEFGESIVTLESRILAERVKHHLQILEIAERLDSIFFVTIFMQYAQSTIVLCVSAIKLSKLQPFGTEFIALMAYLSCMCTEIFLFCFYGHQIMYESLTVSDAIFEMHWPSLTTSTKKCLVMIMSRTLTPIKLTSSSLLTLNIDSFNSLVKLSYSVYTMLQQISEK